MPQLGQGRRGGEGGLGCVRGGGADAAAAELIEITWTTGTTQSVPTASPAPFSVARLVTEPVPVFVSDICPSPASMSGVPHVGLRPG